MLLWPGHQKPMEITSTFKFLLNHRDQGVNRTPACSIPLLWCHLISFNCHGCHRQFIEGLGCNILFCHNHWNGWVTSLGVGLHELVTPSWNLGMSFVKRFFEVAMKVSSSPYSDPCYNNMFTVWGKNQQ